MYFAIKTQMSEKQGLAYCNKGN